MCKACISQNFNNKIYVLYDKRYDKHYIFYILTYREYMYKYVQKSTSKKKQDVYFKKLRLIIILFQQKNINSRNRKIEKLTSVNRKISVPF